MARKRIGDLLLEAGLLTQGQLESALGEQRKTKERLGDVLIRMGFVTESRLIEVLEFQLGIPHVSLFKQRVDPSILSLVPQAMARKHLVFPLRKERNRLVVAMADPLDHYALEDLRMVSGLSIFPEIAAKDELLAFIDRYYGMQGSVEDVLESMRPEEADPSSNELTDDSAPVVRLVNQILQRAAAARASDVHLDPEAGGLRVRFRVDGRLRDEQTLPKHLQSVVTARVKIMAGLNIAEHRLPQDGRFRLRGGNVDVRASTLPTVNGEKTVLRILDGGMGLLSLDKLGLSEDHLRTFKDLFRPDSGMVLITGPTGSGKTTTMYAALREKSSAQMNVITVEDPVEYELSGINQVPVNAAAGMTFARGLRAILRQDPDVIMVGEIRDAETAEMAVRAALTGHFVFSTLHTRDAAATVARLMDMGIEPYQVAAALSGIVAQRLVRRVCRHCKRKGEPTGFESEALAARGLSADGLLAGAGCPACGHTGYLGRMAVYEVLRLDETLRGMIGRGAEESELRRQIRSRGFRSLFDDALTKAAAGATTVSEALRVTWVDSENG